MTNTTVEITGDQVVAGLYQWFQANPWFVKVDIETADLTKEAAAQEALLMLSVGNAQGFQNLSPGIQGLAARFLYSFLAQAGGPLKENRWRLTVPTAHSGAPQVLTWYAIAHEIAQQSPWPSVTH